MQANSNSTTSAPWLPLPERVARGAAWRQAFVGAWLADWRERRRDWRTALVLGLALMLAVVAALVGAQALQRQLQAREQASQAERQRWLEQGRKYPHSAAHYGVYVFKPLSALAAIDPGVERFVGTSVWLEAHKQNDFIHRPAADEGGSTRQFALSPALVLQVLAPLAIVFLGFGSFAREREQGLMGTLRLAGAPLSALAAARAGMLLLLSIVLVIPACLAVVAVQAGATSAAPFVDGPARALLLAAGTLLTLATWSLAVVAVSALQGTLRGSLSTLLALWVATALVLPRLAAEWSQAAAPLPSAQAFREALDADLGEPHDPAEEARQKQALLAQYGVDDVNKLPVNWAGISLQRGEEHGDRIFDAHHGRLFDSLRRQTDAASWVRWLSPTAALAVLSSAAAGSDTAHHLQFVRAAEGQRRLIQKTMNDAITATPGGTRQDAGPELWQKVPTFVFRFEAMGAQQRLALVAPQAAALLASLALCAGALRRLGRGALR